MDADVYRREAIELASGHRACDPDAVERVRRYVAAHHDSEIDPAYLSVEDARRIVAREHGFDDWSALLRRVESDV